VARLAERSKKGQILLKLEWFEAKALEKRKVLIDEVDIKYKKFRRSKR